MLHDGLLIAVEGRSGEPKHVHSRRCGASGEKRFLKTMWSRPSRSRGGATSFPISPPRAHLQSPLTASLPGVRAHGCLQVWCSLAKAIQCRLSIRGREAVVGIGGRCWPRCPRLLHSLQLEARGSKASLRMTSGLARSTHRLLPPRPWLERSQSVGRRPSLHLSAAHSHSQFLPASSSQQPASHDRGGAVLAAGPGPRCAGAGSRGRAAAAGRAARHRALHELPADEPELLRVRGRRARAGRLARRPGLRVGRLRLAAALARPAATRARARGRRGAATLARAHVPHHAHLRARVHPRTRLHRARGAHRVARHQAARGRRHALDHGALAFAIHQST